MSPPLTTQASILQVLLKGPSYGLEIIDRVDHATAGKVRLRHGTIYPTLRSMESAGLLRSWDGEPIAETGGRPRRYYELTALGRRTAREERDTIGGILGLTLEAT